MAKIMRSTDRYRDSQRQRVWDTVGAVPGSGRRDFAGLGPARAVVEEIRRTAWWSRRHPKYAHRLLVAPGSGSSHGVVRLASWQRARLDVLFGLALAVNDRPEAWHGPRFVRYFHDLVKRFEGRAVALRLRQEMNRYGVRMASKRDAYYHLHAGSPEARLVRKRLGVSTPKRNGPIPGRVPSDQPPVEGDPDLDDDRLPDEILDGLREDARSKGIDPGIVER